MTKKSMLSKANDADDEIKRREKQGILHPLRFSTRMVRYPLREVRALEREAGGNHPRIDATQDLTRSTGSRPMKQTQTRKVSTSQQSPEMERKGVVVELEP